MTMLKLLAGPAIAMTATIALCGPAHAQASDTGVNAEDTGGGWQAGIIGGVTLIEGGDSQPYGGVSLTRDVGSGHVGVSAIYVDAGRSGGIVSPVSAKTYQLNLSAGNSWGDFSVDGYVSYGKRKFAVEQIATPAQRIRVTSKGDSFGVGASLSYDIALSDTVVISPALGLDYDRVEIVINANNQQQQNATILQKEKGVTGNAGIDAAMLFGEDGQHIAGISAYGFNSSNGNAYSGVGAGTRVMRVLAARNGAGGADSWGEIGALASFALSDALRWQMGVTRTLGFSGGEVTSLLGGLQIRF